MGLLIVDFRFPILRAATILIVVSASTAGAASVSVDVSPRETYVGVPVQVKITIENANSHEPPIFPDIPNTTVRSNGAPSQQSSMTIINGVTNQSTTLVYSWTVIPKEVGTFIVPSITIDVDGQKQITSAIQVIVSQSETGDLLFVELKGNRESVYVGEQLDVTLQVYIKPYTSREFNVTINAVDMLNRVDFRTSQWGAFYEPLEKLMNRRNQQQQVPLTNTIRKDSSGQDHAYYLFELAHRFAPDRPGQLDVGEINVIMTYPVRLGRSRDIFNANQLSLLESRPVSARLTPSAIAVKPVPTEGRPAIWNGAVGQYAISTTAKPTQVTVGDPITLNMAIYGTGKLETLQPPPLAHLPELTRDFKVPNDPIGGTVEGNTKRFTQSLRATSASVTQIPPIPFAFFDPQGERFVTVYSDAIPLKVNASQNLSMSQIVEAPGSKSTSASPQLTEVQGGILANYSDMDEVLSQQTFRPGWGTALILWAAPLAFIAAFVSRRRAERLRSDTGLARRRTARKHALKQIHSANVNDSNATALMVADALTGYVADRLNLPPGGLTRDELVQRLNARQIRSEVIQRFDELLRECEGMRYAGQDGASGQRMTASAIEVIDNLEREKT